MPTPDCPVAGEYFGPLWPALLQAPFDNPAHYPTPVAFAPRVAWACVAVHYDYPDTMVKAAEEAADPTTWQSRTADLGPYLYPSEIFTQQAGAEFGVGGVVGIHHNPWTFLAAMRVMDDDVTPGTHSDMYRLTGTTSLPGFPASAFIMDQGDAYYVDPTSPPQYARNFGPPEYSSGRYFDAGAGMSAPIPGGTGGELGTHLYRLGNEHPFQASQWTGYLAYNVPPYGPPLQPNSCKDGRAPRDTLGGDWANAWGRPYGVWRGGSADAPPEVIVSGTAPAGAGWQLAARLYRDPMAHIWARKNGGEWLEGAVDATETGFHFDVDAQTVRWPGLHAAPGDAIEIGASNAAAGDWSTADYSDARMGRLTARPGWLVCGQRRRPQFHFG